MLTDCLTLNTDVYVHIKLMYGLIIGLVFQEMLLCFQCKGKRTTCLTKQQKLINYIACTYIDTKHDTVNQD